MTSWADLDVDVVELVACPAPAGTPRLHEMPFRGNGWTSAETASLRDLFAADNAIETIAAELGRPLHGVRSKIHELGLRRNSVRPWSEWDDAELIRSYGEVSAASIAANLSRAVPSIYARAQMLGLTEAAAAPWDAWEDAQLAAGYARGIPVQQLAVMIGRTLSATATRACTLGLRHAAQPPDWSNDEIARMLTLAESGVRYLKIIEILVEEGYPRRTKAGLGPKLRSLGYGRGWGRAWTPDEDALLRNGYATGASLTPITERLGRTQCSIRWRAQELGLRGTHPNRDGFRAGPVWSDDDIATLRAEYGTTRTRELAAKLGRPLRAIYSRTNLLGLRHPFLRDFTPEDDEAIRTAWRDGTPLSRLARTLTRDVAVISKHAIRLGIPFNASDRPTPPNRGRRRAPGPHR